MTFNTRTTYTQKPVRLAIRLWGAADQCTMSQVPITIPWHREYWNIQLKAHTYIHTRSFISNSTSPHCSRLLACLTTILISSVAISLANKPCSHHPPTPFVLYPPAPWPFLCSLSLDSMSPDLNCLWLFHLLTTLPVPIIFWYFTPLVWIQTLQPYPPQANFYQYFSSFHLTSMPDVATLLFHLWYFSCAHLLFDLLCLQNL